MSLWQRLFTNHRRFFVLGSIAITLVSLVGMSRLRIDDDLRSLLRDRDADFRMVDEIAREFGSPEHEVIIFASAQSETLFTPDAIAALHLLLARLERVDDVERVHSMFSVRRLGRVGILLPVVPNADRDLDTDDLQSIRSRAMNHPLVAGKLLSADSRHTLLLVRLTDDAHDPKVARRILADIHTALDSENLRSALTLEVTGLPSLRAEASIALFRDIMVFNVVGIVLAIAFSYWTARRWSAVIVACTPPMVGALWATGLLGLLGVSVNMLTAVVPTLALVVGTCDSVHFIEDVRRRVRRGNDTLTASSAAVGRVGIACGLTSLVTAVGFASLAFARIDAVRSFGIVSALGALASFAAVSTITPLLASTRLGNTLHLGISPRFATQMATRLGNFSIHHERRIVPIGIVATLGCVCVSLFLEADNRIRDSLPRGTPASVALEHMDDSFGGAMGLDVLVRWPASVVWSDPMVLETLEKVHLTLNDYKEISHPLSLATFSGTLSQSSLQRLQPEQLGDFVDPQGRTAIVRSRVTDCGSMRMDIMFGEIEKSLTTLAPVGWTIDLAGMTVVSARNIRQLILDLSSSLTIEVFVIGIILAVAFRSPLIGIISLLPNMFPLAALAAVLVATGRTLEPANIIVFNVCLGLSVDDTVHLLSSMNHHRRPGISTGTAVRRALYDTGSAVVLGGLVLTAGFATVLASRVPSLSGFGLLAATAVMAATVSELMLLPAILVWADRVCESRIFSKSQTGSKPYPCNNSAVNSVNRA